jgi:hypothetical protein
MVIVSREQKKEQMLERLRLKSAEESFGFQIVDGTNCSQYEARIIVDKAKQVFGLGEYSENKVLHDGQMVFFAVSDGVPPGVKIEECEKVRVVLTHLNREEDLEVLKEHGTAAKRRQQIQRMCAEAQEQGALLTQEDLGILLDCDERTVRRDIKELEQKGVIVPTRGTMRDIGPKMTHKEKAIELWLSGKEALDVARWLNHSLHAVERYIQRFCQVVFAQRKLRNILSAAMVVGISTSSATRYWELHQELMSKKSFYRQRLDEVLEAGEAYWKAEGGKKALHSRKNRPGRSKRDESVKRG